MSVLPKDILARWEDPRVMVRDAFCVTPDPWQDDALYSYWKNLRTAMKASKGPGKTATLAWCAWHFLTVRYQAKIVATSITGDNLSDGLWAEMSKWQQRSVFHREAFTWTKSRIELKEAPENWFMSARTWSKSADTSQQANTLAGLHADNMLFMIDEVGGVPDAVVAAAEAGLANDHGNDPRYRARMIIAGNPTHTDGPLYRACVQDKKDWAVVEINSDPDNPKRSPRVSVEWAKGQIEKYGRDNPWVLINVFGQFPPASINALLGVEEVNKAMRLVLPEHTYGWSRKVLGIDVARFGDDRSVIFPRQGLRAFKPVEMRNMRTTDIAARVIAAKTKWESEIEFVDDTGHWGHGVIDNLTTAGHTAIGIQFHGAPVNPRYKNKRAEMWFEMAEWVKKGGALPFVQELVAELTVPTYTYSQGKILIEDKDQIKARLGRSPDYADALALTFAQPDQPGITKRQRFINTAREMQRIGNEESTEYEPHADDYDPHA